MAPNLLNIPPEVQGLIGNQLDVSDLNSLSRTCKILKNVFLAKLYGRAIIKVPVRWSRLVSLENLISSTDSGLQFITNICITAQQQPINDDTQESEDGDTAQETAAERDFLFCLPPTSASKALNVMIRLLLLRVPKNRLEVFNWRHTCALETSTLALLLEHQGAKLHSLIVTRFSEPQNVSSLLVEGLQHLAITDLNIEQRCEWPSKLIVQTRDTLRHLHLGVISRVARGYADNLVPRVSQHGLPATFAEMAKDALFASEGEMVPILSLETLGLYGLNFENAVRGALGLEIEFHCMSSLRLESCSGLSEAFAVLLGNDASQNGTLSGLKLTSFFVWYEARSQAFAQHLAACLTSFTGLKHLGLLLEGQGQAMSKAPILEMHGKTLQTLVWEERRGPRKDTRTGTTFFSKENNLKLVSRKCPNLTALGLPLGWGIRWGISQFSTLIPLLETISCRMPKLQTLHFRNLPKTSLTEIYLSTDHLVKGIASTILDAYARGKVSNRPKSLTTIALGAPLYRDIHIGSNHFPKDPTRDFLQLRVYHVDYKYQSAIGPLPIVTQVAKGTADAATTCLDKDILHEYWLA